MHLPPLCHTVRAEPHPWSPWMHQLSANLVLSPHTHM